MTPDFDWNETNTLVMQFLASATAAMRAKQQAQQQQVEASVTSAYLMETGGDANAVGGYSYPSFASAVFPAISNNNNNTSINSGGTDTSVSAPPSQLYLSLFLNASPLSHLCCSIFCRLIQLGTFS